MRLFIRKHLDDDNDDRCNLKNASYHFLISSTLLKLHTITWQDRFMISILQMRKFKLREKEIIPEV
jgi:hypothetical protein